MTTVTNYSLAATLPTAGTRGISGSPARLESGSNLDSHLILEPIKWYAVRLTGAYRSTRGIRAWTALKLRSHSKQ